MSHCCYMLTATGARPDAVLGETVPRIYTRPLVEGPPGPCGCGCALTPETSDGFEAVEFATYVLGVPPDPWQRWLLIHALELLPDGRPRFRRVIVVVARQNGKTYLLSILANYWMYLRGPLNILGSSTKTAMAVKAWQAAIKLAEAVPELAAEIPAGRGKGIKTGMGHEQWTLINGSRYEPVASNDDGGRGDALDRVISDELRQQKDYSAYNAAYNAMRARPGAQWWGISNMGDDSSVVLNDLRDSAADFIETGDGDPRLGLFEWSAPDGAKVTDVHALAQANPSMNRMRPDGSGFTSDDLLAEARVALKKPLLLTAFKTESMNIRVKAMDPAIDPDAWGACKVDGDLGGLPNIVTCLDVAPLGKGVTLLAGAMLPDGRVRVEPVHRWESVTAAEAELPGWLARNKPRKFGWFPGYEAAAMVATLRERKGRTSWPPKGVIVEEITAEAVAACMAFAAAVEGRQVLHAGDPLLDKQALAAGKLPAGPDRWRFGRQGETTVEALYAAAGVVLLARTLPTPKGRPRVLTPTAARS